MIDELLPLATAIGGAGIAWGIMKANSGSHGRNIKSLWEKKADAEVFRKLETKVEGIDNWTRDHEKESNDVRRQFGERFATLEKAIEVGSLNHQEMTRLITKIEVLIEKMEKKFDQRLEKVEEAIDRRNNA